MKQKLCFLFVILCLLLSGCGQKPVPETAILVNVRETEGFTVLNNGQRIQPGENAVFQLRTDAGLAVVDTDYDGNYYTYVENGQTFLTLEAVPYSTHVGLELSDSYVYVSYDANGGTGPAVTVAWDTTLRPRPNTLSADNRFAREGHTLESWNTRPDGSGIRIGLGSRVAVPDGALTLYAQWAEWTDAAVFDWEASESGVTITGYHGNVDRLVIPAELGGSPVTRIAAGAFQNGTMTQVILPECLVAVEDGAFQGAELDLLTLFDNIETISDGAFGDCTNLRTLRINAMEKPYGVQYRRESCYADKVELLIQAQGQRKMVFYGGCSMWFNLDGSQLGILEEQGYCPINMGINGLVNSSVQMQILEPFLEDGDIFIHTPEFSSAQQMLLAVKMNTEYEDKLWCGLEYNYDLFTLVDMRTVPGTLDTFCDYLGKKKEGTAYTDVYTRDGNLFMDEYGCVSLYRDETLSPLYDEVHMDPSYINETGMNRLREFYDRYQAKGVRIYLSYACFNMDEVPEEQRDSVQMVEERFRAAVKKLDGPVLISELEDFLYQRNDFYDTNYHLLSEAAGRNTAVWLRDLRTQMEQDGLWEAK